MLYLPLNHREKGAQTIKAYLLELILHMLDFHFQDKHQGQTRCTKFLDSKGLIETYYRIVHRLNVFSLHIFLLMLI